MMSIEVNWSSYLGILSQVVGVGGLIVFGFVISWLFGREYSDGTAKDLLALPVSRTSIIQAKFLIYLLWCTALVLFNLLLGFIISIALGLPGFEWSLFTKELYTYFITTLLTILVGTPIALMALMGRGYLTPLGFLVLSIVFAQIISALGFGTYFPWAIPGIYSGSGGHYKEALNFFSYLILVFTSLAGYYLTILWWRLSDQ
jgi:ABC-2 type transport system permease protein